MNRPNIVFIIADQHRWDFIGGGANGVTYTPNLDRLARQGVHFNATYCTSPLCSPSRAALASGRYGMNTGCFTNLHELPAHTPSFVGQLRRAGYQTSAVGKTHMEIHAYDSDLTSERHRAFMDSLGWNEICEISGNGMLRTGIKCAYSEYLKQVGKFAEVVHFYENWHYFMEKEKGGDPNFACHEWPLPERYQETAFVGQRSLEWLEERDRSRPFLLHVGFAAPHSPIEPFPAYMDLYRDRPETEPWGNVDPPSWLADGRRGYRAMISQVDFYVGQIYDSIVDQGILDNTIFIYCADHGEMAGDQGLDGKTCFYEASVRVPLIVTCPLVHSQQKCSALVEILDLGKTICDLCSVDVHPLDQGRSLVPILRGQSQSHRNTVYAEMGCDKMLRDERYKLMWGAPDQDTRKLGRLHLDKPVNIPPSPCRLYDLQEDPHELRDLAADGDYRDLLYEMMEKLLVRLGENVQTQPNKSRGEYRPVRL